MQAGTEAEALTLADFNKPRGAGGDGFSVDTFRHEENAIGGDFGESQQERFNFDQIVFGRDDEFQLKWIISNPFGNDFGL